MYQSNTCHRTYHWHCLLDLECYTDAQCDGSIVNDVWACPDCSLTPTQKKERSNFSRELWFWTYFNPLLKASTTKFTGFSVCHPHYDDSVMLNMMRHAIHSYLCTEIAIATFLLLPNWKGHNAKAYMQVLRKHPEHCIILGNIPQVSVTYLGQNFWMETMQALQLVNGILVLLLYRIKNHSTCYLMRTQGGVQPCLMPYPSQFSNPAHIHPLRARQK